MPPKKEKTGQPLSAGKKTAPMKLPTNTLKVSKGIDRAFDFLINPWNLSELIKDEYHGKIIYNKKAQIEKGSTFKLIVPANKGQLAIDMELEECVRPYLLKYNILSVSRKKGRKEEIVPLFLLVDGVSHEIRLKEAKNCTTIKFTTSITGAKGLITNAFIYLFFGVAGWFSNRNYLAKLGRLINQNA